MDRRRDDAANINLDFLIGLVIFLTAFIYLLIAVPSIFIPYQSNSVDLGSVLYRTSCILAEDPGWYAVYATNVSYSDWETSGNTDQVTRVGLAVDKRMPNVLSLDKIHALQGLNYTWSREKLGLNGTVSYDYHLSIRQIEPVELELLNTSSPPEAESVDKMDRLVLIREGEGLFIDCSEPGTFGYSFNLTLDKEPRFDDRNVTVRIVNFTANPYSTENISVVYYPGPLKDAASAIGASYGAHDFYIYKNNIFVTDYVNEPYNATDVIDVIVDAKKLHKDCYETYGYNVSRIEVYSNLATTAFPSGIQDYNLTNPNYRYFNKLGVMQLKVWRA